MKRLFVIVALLSSPALAAGLGPASPPPGVAKTPDGAAMWKEITTNAAKGAKHAAKLVPGANAECLEAIILKVLATREVEASGTDGLPVTVDPTKTRAFSDAVERNRNDKCNGGDGGATVEAMAQFSLRNSEWDTDSDFAKLRREYVREEIRWLYETSLPKMKAGSVHLRNLAMLGVLVPAIAGSTPALSPAAASFPLPIIVRPEWLSPRAPDTL